MEQTAFCVLVLVFTVTAVGAWINEVDQRANFTCPQGQMLYHIMSEHVNSAEDRRWDFGCRNLHIQGDIEQCLWSGFVNEVDMPLNYACEGEGFVTGIDSIHYNSAEDRRFNFYCCSVRGAVVHGCYFTGWENTFDGLLDYLVPNKRILHGIESVHANSAEDRKFKFNICEYDLQ